MTFPTQMVHPAGVKRVKDLSIDCEPTATHQPLHDPKWIPAFAGMTAYGSAEITAFGNTCLSV